jgi:hypothetical protein
MGINSKSLALILILIMTVSCSTMLSVKPVNAQVLSLTIEPDGSVEPSTDLLERNGTTYTFKGDIFGSIWVQTNYITIDGAGHTLQGNGISTGQNSEIGILLGGPDLSYRRCRNVLVENLRIYNIPRGIFSVGSSNNSFFGNYFENSGIHLQGSANYTGDQIKHNTFINASIFVDYDSLPLDVLTENNFVDSVIFVDLSVPPIVEKNYWSNYTAEYPNAKELDNSAIWDTPNVYDKFAGGSHGNYSCIDYHPLVNPITDFAIPNFNDLTLSLTTTSPYPTINTGPESPNPEPFPTTLAVASIVSLAIVGAALLIYFKKHRSECK